MNKIIFLLLVFLNSGYGQEYAKWSYEVKKITESQFDLIFEAQIEKDWHVYALTTPEGGSLPMEISYNKMQENFELLTSPTEFSTHKQFSEVFGVEEVYFKDKLRIVQRIKLLNTDLNYIKGKLFYQVCKEVCLNKEKQFVFHLTNKKKQINILNTISEKSKRLSKKMFLPLKKINYIKESDIEKEKKKGLFQIFLLGFIGGLLALFTPCVFPMIPLTVSFFTKHTKDRRSGIIKAIFYGFFIFLIYLLLSIPFHLIESVAPNVLNMISTNIWLNIFFFLIFVFFSFSFFGYYEITLPSKWGNKIDSASTIGGYLGIFFMALTLTIVSFSCTGPILGSLLAGSLSATNGAEQLTYGMAGFGVSLGLPFAIFALFPNLLNAMPKSGNWMNSVKIFLGFIELALAFKFLSNADMVAHWEFLKRETFIIIWLVILTTMLLNIFKVIRFPHDRKAKFIFTFKNSAYLIILLVMFCYLTLGLVNKSNLNILNGIIPPNFYSLKTKKNDCPLELNCFKDFETGFNYAIKVNKPILIDFTGWACANCRKMEENVWAIPKNYLLIKDKFVLISLYVDDREKLKKETAFDFLNEDGTVSEVNTVGKKWSIFQTLNFKTASQPFYILMNTKYELLNQPIQYTDIETYYQWLTRGLENFHKSKD